MEQKSSIGDLLLAFRRKIIEELKKKGHNDDLTFSQVEVLHLIGPKGKRTMKNIADYLKITPPSATVMIAEMEKKGLVKRLTDKDDRRIVDIVLTENTKKLYLTISKKKELILEKMVSKLNEKDRKDLERIIRILIKE